MRRMRKAVTMSCPSGGRLSTSPRSTWACCTACMLVLMVPIRACCAELCDHTAECHAPVALSSASVNKHRFHTSPLSISTTRRNIPYSRSVDAARAHQRGHVSSVHLARRDLLLGGWHGARVEGLGPDRARTHDGGQCHRAVLHAAYAVELLLQDGGPDGMVPLSIIIINQSHYSHYH